MERGMLRMMIIRRSDGLAMRDSHSSVTWFVSVVLTPETDDEDVSERNRTTRMERREGDSSLGDGDDSFPVLPFTTNGGRERILPVSLSCLSFPWHYPSNRNTSVPTEQV